MWCERGRIDEDVVEIPDVEAVDDTGLTLSASFEVAAC